VLHEWVKDELTPLASPTSDKLSSNTD
jgi:hypothetical protein